MLYLYLKSSRSHKDSNSQAPQEHSLYYTKLNGHSISPSSYYISCRDVHRHFSSLSLQYFGISRWESQDSQEQVTHLVFVIELDEVGFHSQDPDVIQAGGSIFTVFHTTSPVRGDSLPISWTRPRFLPHNLIRPPSRQLARLWAEAWNLPKNTPCLELFSGMGQGIRWGAHCFQGAGDPIMNTSYVFWQLY